MKIYIPYVFVARSEIHHLLNLHTFEYFCQFFPLRNIFCAHTKWKRTLNVKI